MLCNIKCIPLHQLFMVLVLRQTKDECRETISSVFRFMLMVLEGYFKAILGSDAKDLFFLL